MADITCTCHGFAVGGPLWQMWHGSPSTEPAPETCPWSVYPNGSFRCVLERGHNGLHQVMFGDLEKAEPAPTPESEAPRRYPPNAWHKPNAADLRAELAGAVPVSVPPGEAERLVQWLADEAEAARDTAALYREQNPESITHHADEIDALAADYDAAAALLRSQARELAIRDAEITEWDTLTTTQIREIAELSRELEEATKIYHDAENEAVTLCSQVAELSRQLEEANSAVAYWKEKFDVQLPKILSGFADELAALRTQLEEAKRPIPREGERIVLTWLDAMHAKYPASEYGMAAVFVRSLSRQLEEAKNNEAMAMTSLGKLLMYPHPRELLAQLEEARTENERLRGIVKLYARHTEECLASNAQAVFVCTCGLSGLLEVSG